MKNSERGLSTKRYALSNILGSSSSGNMTLNEDD